MGLFSGWFSKRRNDGRPMKDWRQEERRRISTAWPPVEARFGKTRGQVLDLSDEGFCVAIDEGHAPNKELVVIRQGEEILARGYAMLVWRGGSRVGYNFATGLDVEHVQEQRAQRAGEVAAEDLPSQTEIRQAIVSPRRGQDSAAVKERAALEAVKAKLNEAAQQQRSASRERSVAFPNEADLNAIQRNRRADAEGQEPTLPFQASQTSQTPRMEEITSRQGFDGDSSARDLRSRLKNRSSK